LQLDEKKIVLERQVLSVEASQAMKKKVSLISSYGQLCHLTFKLLIKLELRANLFCFKNDRYWLVSVLKAQPNY
jgi:hypothetical protein